MATKKKNYRSKKGYTTAWLIPLFFIIGVVPLIMRGTVINLSELEQSVWISQETRFDVFSYWKSVWFVFATLGATGILAWLHFDKKIKVEWPLWLVVPIGIYLFFTLVSFLAAPDLNLAARGFIEIFQGVLVMMSYGIIIFLGFNLIQREVDVKVMMRWLLVLWGITFFIGFSQFFGFDVFRREFVQRIILPGSLSELVGNLNFTFGPRTIYATMYNTNFVGSYAALMVPISLAYFLFTKETKPQIVGGAFFAMNVFVWYGSNARSGLMGVLIAALIFGALWFFEGKVQWKKMVVALGILVGVFIVTNTASDGRTLNQFLGLTPGGEGSLIELESTEIAYFEELNIDEFKFELVTDKKSVVVEYVAQTGSLAFTDLEDGALSIGIRDGAIVLNEEGYESFSFQFIAEAGALRVSAYQSSFDIFITDEGFVMQGVGGVSSETVNAPRIEFLDGLERVASGRGYIWSRSIPMLANSVFIGYGPDMYVLNFPQRDFSGRLNGFTLTGINDKPHNMFLQIALNVGLVSLLALLFIYGYYFYDTAKLFWKRPLETIEEYIGLGVATGIFAYLVAGIFNDQIISVAPAFYALSGIGLALNRMIRNLDGPKDPQPQVAEAK